MVASSITDWPRFHGQSRVTGAGRPRTRTLSLLILAALEVSPYLFIASASLWANYVFDACTTLRIRCLMNLFSMQLALVCLVPSLSIHDWKIPKSAPDPRAHCGFLFVSGYPLLHRYRCPGDVLLCVLNPQLPFSCRKTTAGSQSV